MGLSSKFAQYITQKLSGLKNANIEQSGNLSFGSLTAINNNLSVFESAASDTSTIDYEKIMESINSGNLEGLDGENSESLASVLNELISIKEIQELADVSGDGKIDGSELEVLVSKMAGNDGDAKNLTFADIDKMLEDMGIDLNKTAETAVSEAVKDLDEPEETKKAQETEAPSSAQQSSSTGGTSGSNSAGRTSSPTKTTNNQATAGDTAEEIKAQIDEKNGEISDVEADAEAQIQEQEKAKEQAMKNAGVSEEEYKKYQEKEKEIEGKITEKESAIDKKDNEIRDKESSVSSNESYISSLDSQISANESKKSSIASDDKDASSKSADIDSKISNLRSEKQQKEEENNKLKQEIEKAKQEKTQLETDKQTLETQKQELLSKTLDSSTGFCKGISDSSATAKVKDNIAQFDTKIQEIKAEKQEKVSSLKGEIQTLEVKLKDIEAKEERDKFLDDNKAKTGLGLSGEELVGVAKQMLDKYGSSSGYCATGVSRTFEMAYGLDLHGNGCDWDTNMDNLVQQGAFEEVTGDYASSNDLANLPAGAVVCWEATGGDSGGAKYGHVTIADGNGGEISDHYAANIYKSIGGRSDQYRVYLPVS